MNNINIKIVNNDKVIKYLIIDRIYKLIDTMRLISWI